MQKSGQNFNLNNLISVTESSANWEVVRGCCGLLFISSNLQVLCHFVKFIKILNICRMVTVFLTRNGTILRVSVRESRNIPLHSDDSDHCIIKLGTITSNHWTYSSLGNTLEPRCETNFRGRLQDECRIWPRVAKWVNFTLAAVFSGKRSRFSKVGCHACF